MVSNGKKQKAYEMMELILKACKSEMTNEQYNGIIDKCVSDYACYEDSP